MSKFIDLMGQRFGRLTVLYRLVNDKHGNACWMVKCDCGKEIEVPANSLKSGNTKSCGCYARDMMRNNFKKNFGSSTKNDIYCGYKHQAKQKNVSFELSFEQFIDLTQQNCHYCGIEPNNLCVSRFNNGDFTYNGIDRKDNAKGYTLENSLSCCIKCNKAKGTMTYEEFKEWIDRLAKNNGYEKTMNKSRRLEPCQEKLMNC